MTEKVLAHLFKNGERVAIEDITKYTVLETKYFYEFQKSIGRTVVTKRELSEVGNLQTL